MSDNAASADDRHSRILAELAGLSLALARDLQARALAAEDAEEATKLARAFQSVSRGLRQTLALDLKVIRYKDDLAREERKAAAAEAEAVKLRAETLARAVEQRSRAVHRKIDHAFRCEDPDWNVGDEEDEARRPFRPPADDPMWDRLDAYLEQAEAEPDFLTRDFDLMVIEACDAIGLDPGLLYEIRERRETEPATADSS